MAHIILTGATGTIGAAVLSHALANPNISKISILSRRPVKSAENQPKAHVYIHKDFSTYHPTLLKLLKDAQGCIWAQGISSRGIPEDEYTQITVEYPKAAAVALAEFKKEGKMNFVYVSGEGAQMDGKASMMFGRVKGRAERELLALQTEHPVLKVYSVRPAGISTQGRYLAERKPTLQDRLVMPLASVLEKVWKSFVVPADQLAKVLVQLAAGDGEPLAAGVGVEADGRLLRNTGIRKLAGL